MRAPSPRSLVLVAFIALVLGAIWALPTLAASDAEAQEITHLINNERATHGLAPLTLDPLLSAAAQGHSDDLAVNNFVSHDSSDGRVFWDRMVASGFPALRGGEVVAAGYPGPSELVRGWMGSPPHQAILLMPELTHLGVGHAWRGGTTYGHYWTVDAGVPWGDYAP